MKKIKSPRNISISLIITFILAIIGTFLGLEGMEEWYPSLIKPLDVPLWLFAIVQPLYYIICIVIMYRLLTYKENKREKFTSLFLLLFMMIYAEVWNYFFLGLKSVSTGFWTLLIFAGIVLLLFQNLYKSDNKSARLLIPYLIWLIVDCVWMYSLWEANSYQFGPSS